MLAASLLNLLPSLEEAGEGGMTLRRYSTAPNIHPASETASRVAKSSEMFLFSRLLRPLFGALLMLKSEMKV